MSTPASAKPRVAVLFGGRSSEHAISCVTAAGVLAAIDRDRYEVVPVGITRSGRWVLVPDDPSPFALVDGELPEVPADGTRVALAQEVSERALQALDEPPAGVAALQRVDVVLPLLHGPFGEDGTLQGLLELSDTRYVGSGVLASAVSMDKQAMKVLLAGAGLRVGPWTSFHARRWAVDEAACRAAVDALGYPVFVKPARAGSSIGITRVDGPDGLATAVAEAAAHDPKVVVEAAVAGREVECGVIEDLDGGAPRTSVPGEIEVVGDHAFYDFEAKYLDADGVRLTCPADLPADVEAAVRRTAARVFEAMGAEGLARVDLFVDVERGEDGVVVNEINTMPGFTPHSMFPRMWAATGVTYPELVDHLLQLALNRPTGLR
ncbi:D-alanine--D-alanine ligase [Paenibacillus sp. TRM 82003]|uniref:D-alanine--D-alanine ligase family protein n=1 Tax=Kineococcus sp. TRM81007 TaxID=2925831 RepID=UPI001F576320|nr:D-alanine--D-alanine ligase family protein [Kineococcus sp. TRM81007]MCI2240201.1 D-alanine--D-alanine ligase [Kineococcus sp. TRM81007]MCI3927621.1 D-alanine--D-alanine ligase [Paenibacillus sp. TRM 82003]